MRILINLKKNQQIIKRVDSHKKSVKKFTKIICHLSPYISYLHDSEHVRYEFVCALKCLILFFLFGIPYVSEMHLCAFSATRIATRFVHFAFSE